MKIPVKNAEIKTLHPRTYGPGMGYAERVHDVLSGMLSGMRFMWGGDTGQFYCVNGDAVTTYGCAGWYYHSDFNRAWLDLVCAGRITLLDDASVFPVEETPATGLPEEPLTTFDWMHAETRMKQKKVVRRVLGLPSADILYRRVDGKLERQERGLSWLAPKFSDRECLDRQEGRYELYEEPKKEPQRVSVLPAIAMAMTADGKPVWWVSPPMGSSIRMDNTMSFCLNESYEAVLDDTPGYQLTEGKQGDA